MTPAEVRKTLDQIRRNMAHSDLMLRKMLDHYGLTPPTEEEIDAVLAAEQGSSRLT